MNSALPSRPRWLLPLVLTIAVHVLPVSRTRSEDHVDYKFEDYEEQGGRIRILTHAALFELTANSWLSLKGHYVYDGISGASPTGAPPPAGSDQVPLAELDDVRQAGDLTLAAKLGRHTLSPQFAYSSESDYRSLGLSLSDAIEFNDKNTTLIIGAAHNFDEVQPVFWDTPRHKNSTDVLIGVTQLLNPKTVLTANLTLGYSAGYLTDPYKGFRFDGYPDPTAIFPEKRPRHKSKEILMLTLAHYFDALNAGAELEYRFYHDSFGIKSHTAGVTWNQKLGKRVILSPLFRYYDQTAADFYAVRLPGDPSDPDSLVPIPAYYSADYRLSKMHTFTYGISATVIVNDHLHLDAAFKRYEMFGDDGVTSDSAYPTANVFSIGGSVWF